MSKERLSILLRKYRNGELTDSEKEEIDLYYEQLGQEKFLELPPDVTEDWESFVDGQYLQLKQVIASRKQRKINVWKSGIYKIAASVVILLAAAYFIYLGVHKENKVAVSAVLNDVQPGHSGAVLTLADGRKIMLDSSGNGNIAQQGDMQVTNHDGQLSYNKVAANAASIAYNILSTPKARQYKLVLPDGTKAWLNAASSIRYPTAFSGNERKVYITGEVYFDVVHDAKNPFKVAVNNSLITDIGTRFNVYAYNDEPVLQTTLLEGSVQIGGQILKPGYQAQVNQTNGIKIVKIENPEDVVAWKQGNISFNNVDIQTLMRQLSRWYDIDVQYVGKIPEEQLLGTISRQTPLSAIVHVLEENDIHCKIQGNKLIVYPK